MAMLVRQLNKPGSLVSSSDSHLLMSGYVLLESDKDVGQHDTEDGEELIVFVEGTADVICGTKRETVHAPAVAHIPAHTMHNVENRSKSPLKYAYVYVPARNHS